MWADADVDHLLWTETELLTCKWTQCRYLLDSEVNAHCCDWLTVVYVWQCTFLTDGRRGDLGQKRINNSIQTKQQWSRNEISYSHLCCDITVGSNIFNIASSFSFTLSENPSSNCASFVNESSVKWNEQKSKFLLTWSGSSLKVKFTHSFLTLGSEGRQCKHCFSTAWHCTASSYLQSIFIIWFLRRPACLPLVIYTTCMKRWVGLNRQWCRVGGWG